VLLLAFFGWSRSLPSEFTREKFGRIATGLGCLSRLCPRLMVFFHYIILILLLVMLGQVGNGQCKLSIAPADSTASGSVSTEVKYTAMQKEGSILLAILSVMWVVMAIGGWVTRSLIYIEPWYVDPHDP
jgi:hypothetical protein